MGNKLSHSASNVYNECPRKYELHYIEKLRPVVQSSALLFGSAIDKALEACVKGEDPVPIFIKEWTFGKINNEVVYLPNSELIRYFKSDFDSDLLEKDKAFFSPNASWDSLKVKGLLMIQAFQKEVLPNIEELLGTQVKVELANEEGDFIIGFADLVVKWKGIKEPVILDIKTATKPYEKNSVKESPQLGLYRHALADKFEGTTKAGYIVLGKKIKKNVLKTCNSCGVSRNSSHKSCPEDILGKRCEGSFSTVMIPECPVQIIIDDISSELEDMIIENFDTINQSIANKEFPCNFDACNPYYGPCPYVKLCHEGSYEGLIDMKEKK